MNASILNVQHLSKVVPSAEGELTILEQIDFELARGGRDIALACNALKDAYLIIKRVIHSISLRHPRLIIKYRLNIFKSMTA